MKIEYGTDIYALFLGIDYYPYGGWDDFKEFALSVELAIMISKKYKGDWAHIVNFGSGKIVLKGERQPSWDDDAPWIWYEVKDES